MLKRSIYALTMTVLLSTAQAQTFSFGLWGDMPDAKAGDEAKMPAVVHSINQATLDFSIFVGDIKDGSSKCTDDVYARAQTLFNSMVKPVVYIPGDNEWTDCHRLNNGDYDALERLSHIRKFMFATPLSHGQQKMSLLKWSKSTWTPNGQACSTSSRSWSNNPDKPVARYLYCTSPHSIDPRP